MKRIMEALLGFYVKRTKAVRLMVALAFVVTIALAPVLGVSHPAYAVGIAPTDIVPPINPPSATLPKSVQDAVWKFVAYLLIIVGTGFLVATFWNILPLLVAAFTRKKDHLRNGGFWLVFSIAGTTVTWGVATGILLAVAGVFAAIFK